MAPTIVSTPKASAGTEVSAASPSSQGRPLATALPASWRTLRALCEASPDWVKPTSTPAAARRAAFSRVAPTWSKPAGRLASGSTNTGTSAEASSPPTFHASAPPDTATFTPLSADQRSSWRMSAARSTLTTMRPEPSRKEASASRPAGVSIAACESGAIRPRASSTSWSSSIHCAARELPLSRAASEPRSTNSSFGPAGSRLPSRRTTAPCPPMIEPPWPLEAPSRVQPMPSVRVTGISTDSGL